MTTRMFYVDDSGAAETGWVVYSWLECTIEDWRHGLRAWLDLRKRMYTEHAIPPTYELHTTKFIGGHGRPSLDPAWNLRKANRRIVLEEALDVIGSCTHLGVGTVYRRHVRRAHRTARSDLYARWISDLESRLAAADELGMIFMDGDGTDPLYYAAHRELKLAHRHIIEDPLFQHSHRSQWVQMADLVAYAGYIGTARPPGREFAWDWYHRYLLGRDVNDGPQEL